MNTAKHLLVIAIGLTAICAATTPSRADQRKKTMIEPLDPNARIVDVLTTTSVCPVSPPVKLVDKIRPFVGTIRTEANPGRGSVGGISA